VQHLNALGAKETEIADFFGVSVVTVWNWKAKYPEFLKASKLSKEQHDERVERSLREKALGYTAKETKVFNINGELKTKTITRHYPPDTTACMFWLQNRQPERWRNVQHIENSHTIEASETDDLDLARKLVFLLQKGEQALTH
jgi:hypothetical protein